MSKRPKPLQKFSNQLSIMPNVKLKLTKDLAAKAAAAHDLAGTRTVEAFENAGVYHTVVGGRSIESLVEFGMVLGGMTDEGVKAYQARVDKKAAAVKAAAAKKGGN